MHLSFPTSPFLGRWPFPGPRRLGHRAFRLPSTSRQVSPCLPHRSVVHPTSTRRRPLSETHLAPTGLTSGQAPPTGLFKDRPSAVSRAGVLSHTLSPACFGSKVPPSVLGPSSRFLTTSTVCSTNPAAGLLHPASGHGVHRVSAITCCHRRRFPTDAHALQSLPLPSSCTSRRRGPLPPRRLPAASWFDLEAFFHSPVRCACLPLPACLHPLLSWASLLEPHARCLSL